MDDLLTISEAAEILGVTAGRVRQLVAAGRLKAVKYGKRMNLLPRAVVLDFAAQPRPNGKRLTLDKH